MNISVSGNYTVVLDDPAFILNTDKIYLQCNTALGAVNITLPRISTSGRTWGFRIYINDVSVNAATNNITIIPNAADRINGSASSIVLNTNGVTGCAEIIGTTAWAFNICNSTAGGTVYTKYIANMTQTGTNAPVPTIFENTIGTIVWSRTGAGNYLGTLLGAFPESKTFLLDMGYSANSDPVSAFIRVDNDSVNVKTGGDGILLNNAL